MILESGATYVFTGDTTSKSLVKTKMFLNTQITGYTLNVRFNITYEDNGNEDDHNIVMLGLARPFSGEGYNSIYLLPLSYDGALAVSYSDTYSNTSVMGTTDTPKIFKFYGGNVSEGSTQTNNKWYDNGSLTLDTVYETTIGTNTTKSVITKFNSKTFTGDSSEERIMEWYLSLYNPNEDKDEEVYIVNVDSSISENPVYSRPRILLSLNGSGEPRIHAGYYKLNSTRPYIEVKNVVNQHLTRTLTINVSKIGFLLSDN